MNKRSAMAIAGGLVAALVSAAGAISVSLTNRTPAQAQPTRAAKPIVKTVRRTITIHKKAKAPATPPRVVTLAPSAPSSQAPPVTVSSGSSAHGGESDEGGDGEGRGGDD